MKNSLHKLHPQLVAAGSAGNERNRSSFLSSGFSSKALRIYLDLVRFICFQNFVVRRRFLQFQNIQSSSQSFIAVVFDIASFHEYEKSHSVIFSLFFHSPFFNFIDKIKYSKRAHKNYLTGEYEADHGFCRHCFQSLN